jgi:hypothetical protein
MMGAMTNGGPEGILRRVTSREQFPNYVSDMLECGHTVADHDNRRPIKRRCLACFEAQEAARPPRRCLACGRVVVDGGEWCDAVCGREVLRAMT